MTQLDENAGPGADERREGRARPGTATVAGTVALALWSVAGTAGGVMEHRAVRGLDGQTDPDAFLASVAAHQGAWNAYSIFMLIMLVMTVAWVPAVWRLGVRAAPRWAWAAAALGGMFALGQAVHLMSWAVLTPALAAAVEPGTALALVSHLEGMWLFHVIFAPFLVGFLLAPPVAAVALRRAGVLRAWSVACVVVASAASLVLGLDQPVMFVAYPALMVTGFLPALGHVLEDRRA